MLHPETTNPGESEDVSYFFAVLYAVFLYFCVYLNTKVDTRAGNTGRKEGIRHNNVPLHKANQMCGLCRNQTVTGRSVFTVCQIPSVLFLSNAAQIFPAKDKQTGSNLAP